MAQTEATTVRKQVVVDTPIERAFSVFTGRFGDFKPPEHNLLGAPITETVFEPRVGGAIVDRAADGSECRWARILAFDPPERVVFSWARELVGENPSNQALFDRARAHDQRSDRCSAGRHQPTACRQG